MRILVVDDHFEIREKVKAMLSLHNDIEIDGQAENGQSAIELCMSRGALNTTSMGAFKTTQLIFLFHTLFCHNPQV
jgi:DNA-binding NarL/FixJ family response regulator